MNHKIVTKKVVSEAYNKALDLYRQLEAADLLEDRREYDLDSLFRSYHESTLVTTMLYVMIQSIFETDLPSLIG